MRLKQFLIAAGVLTLSAGAASAATITNDLNLRAGPGTNYGVVATMPAGAYVSVRGCTGNWCRVTYRGRVGYASASYLAGGGAYAAAPPVYYGPPRTVFQFGIGSGSRWHNRGWRDRGPRYYRR